MESGKIVNELSEILSSKRFASKVTCSFRTTAKELTLEVSVDGKGFDPAKLSDRKSLGLLGMRERALLFSGRLEIQSAAAKGTIVTVRIPLGPGSRELAGGTKNRAP